jgi:hypothetical protein
MCVYCLVYLDKGLASVNITDPENQRASYNTLRNKFSFYFLEIDQARAVMTDAERRRQLLVRGIRVLIFFCTRLRK